jgi:uncharacterized protein (DUF4415 family)
MKKSGISKKSQTDWDQLITRDDADIDFTDIPGITPEMFAQAVVRHGLNPPLKKEQLTIRLDGDVLTWFKSQGRGYQTRINALLRAYMEAHKQQGQ